MEPDVSIESSSMIRVAVLPIGTVPPTLLRDYYSMLLRHQTVPLSAISSFYTEHQKSPFAHQPWDSGSLHFKFVLGGSPPCPWEDFQSHRKTLAVIGICHCPSSPDLDSVVDQFANACNGYSSSLVDRCFAFCPCDSQLEEESKRGGNVMLFPPGDRHTQELHLHTMMQDMAASLLMEFEKWVLQAESSGAILKTPLDSQASLSSEEVIKAKKRRLGRAQKTIGDYCLMAGSPVDANNHYYTAQELARLTGDFFWYSGALEGSVCALLIDQMDLRDSALEEEVRYQYNSVIMNYRKSQDNAQRVSPLSFELEATLKLARFLCRREWAKERKAAFFSRQVAHLYLQQDNRLAAISAVQVLAMTTKAYHVQSRASISEHSLQNQTGSSNADSGKMHHQSAVSLFESQWSNLQMIVLREILVSAIRAGDPLAAWSAAARLLRSYYPFITPAGQNGLANALSNTAERLPPGTHCADPALPFVRLYSFPLLPSQIDIVKRNPAREDWWAGDATSGPFIYTPFSKDEPNNIKEQELIWIVGEPVQILVELANPCGFDLRVDSIYLSVHSGNFDAFPVSVNLAPSSSKVVILSGIPTSVGPVTIPGCTVHCFGVITEHLFKDVDNLLLGAAQGLVLSDPFRCCGSVKLRSVSVPSISVVPSLPLLVSHFVGGDGSIILYEGEFCDVWISLSNAGTVSVDQAHISLSGKNQDSVISYAYDTLKSALPLKPGAKVTIPVTLKAWQLATVDPDNVGKNISGSIARHPKDGSSPSLVIHYAGPLENTGDPPPNGSGVPLGRRLVVPLQVCVLQGLFFAKARLLSMEFPAHVGENLPRPVHVDDNSSGGHPGSEGKIDRLVKIDPFRGSWGLQFLELELSNPTDVGFEINVSVKLENSRNENISSVHAEVAEFGYPKTRIDRDCSARVLVPLGPFKLPILDDSFLMKDIHVGEVDNGRYSSFSEKNCKAELNACIKNLVSRIKIRWHSGRNSSGELNIKDAIQAALQTSVMDVLLPDPLTFGFRLASNGFKSAKPGSDKESNIHIPSFACKGSVLAHDMTPMEVLVRNNTKDMIKMRLSITSRDIAGENCIEDSKETVFWAGVLSGISMEVPPLQEIKHSFSLYFLVPGEYTLVAAAVIDDAYDILRTRASTNSPDGPIFCRGPPYHVRVIGTA
ncbi:trafficking protein particle complex II-specific subunit 120-like [Quillaja saponaria]|uniref:Trafficking protein particle complex II-specific subunit 120-like n=1 Tax=Quillaja saponaria TaxID=32244 RepID=A0AAD7LIL0_QUISA|nr:trafficking protein particle complex II-specific subunit 120-like [Quillaja saponaria]